MNTKTLFIAAVAATASSVAAQTLPAWTPTTVGPWTATFANRHTVSILAKALSSDIYYNSAVSSRLCFASIQSVEQQALQGVTAVSGVNYNVGAGNYRYKVQACVVQSASTEGGMCRTACTPAAYQVELFEEADIQALQVTAVTAL